MAPQNKQEPEIPELYSGRNWRLIEAIVAGVILLAIIGFLVWYFFFSTTSSSSPTPKTPSTSKNQPKSDGNSPSKAPNDKSSQNKPESSGNANTNPKSSQALSNTGPGESIAIFLGAAAVASLAYKFKTRLSDKA